MNLADRFKETREHTEKICAPLNTEDYVAQPIVDVSPPKWHLAHTTWFFETFLLKPFKKNYLVFDEDFNYLFNSYYETIGKRVLRDSRGTLTRPETSKIYDYRAYVNSHLEDYINNNEITDEVYSIIELGLQHEQQHQELLYTDIKYILGQNPINPVYDSSFKETIQDIDYSTENFIKTEEGVYEIGYKGHKFHFDNEKGVHKVYLNEYYIANRLISNKEYIDFIEAGGYTDFNNWLAEAWDWVNKNEIQAPEYWEKVNGEWYRFSLNGLKKINLNEPVTHISFFEADAYARWRGMRLPTEFEWEIASNKFDYGQRWEWTNSAYLPYPNYQKAEGAIGEYNGKFMINQMVLRGGSIATPKNHCRPTYRNFWHPHLRWQFNGIRLAKNI